MQLDRRAKHQICLLSQLSRQNPDLCCCFLCFLCCCCCCFLAKHRGHLQTRCKGTHQINALFTCILTCATSDSACWSFGRAIVALLVRVSRTTGNVSVALSMHGSCSIGVSIPLSMHGSCSIGVSIPLSMHGSCSEAAACC